MSKLTSPSSSWPRWRPSPGCGSGGSSSSGDEGGGGGSRRDGRTKAESTASRSRNCLIEEDFIVQPSEGDRRQSPAGVYFTLILYKDPAAAKAAYDKKDPKTSALVENG